VKEEDEDQNYEEERAYREILWCSELRTPKQEGSSQNQAGSPK
jgi:hypothetical protein